MKRSPDLLRYILAERSKRDAITGCLEWQRGKRGGYGRLYDGERVVDTHRLAYELWVGPIPNGLDVLHSCDNPSCIAPKHLWCGTHQQNMKDRDAKGRQRSGANKMRGRASSIRGAKHPLARLRSADQARTIFVDPRPALDIAIEHNISTSSVYAIKHRRLWAWATKGC